MTSSENPIVRFLPDRLSNGHHGVFDTQLEAFVVRNVAGPFATRVAACLNAPAFREHSEPQLVANAVRAALEMAQPGPAGLVH